jgi:hypothetical protein
MHSSGSPVSFGNLSAKLSRWFFIGEGPPMIGKSPAGAIIVDPIPPMKDT